MDFQIVIDSLRQILIDIANFIPNLINGLIILLVGYLISALVRWGLRTFLNRCKFDALVERTGITDSLRGLGVRTPLSTIIAHSIFVLLFLSFLITGTRLMGLEAVAQLLEELLALLPNLIAAMIVFLIGGMVAQFVGGLVTGLAASANLGYALRLGKIIQYLVSVFVIILVLGVVGIDTALLVTTFTILIAAVGLAVGLALGLGARPVVYHILAGYYMRQRLPVGRAIRLGQVRGEVSGIGRVNALVTTDEDTLLIPNGILLERVLRSPRQPDKPE